MDPAAAPVTFFTRLKRYGRRHGASLLTAGLCAWLAGFYLAPSSGAHDRIFYNLYAIPAGLVLLAAWRPLLSSPVYTPTRIVISLLLLMCLPVLWGESADPLYELRKILEHAILAVTLIFGVTWISQKNSLPALPVEVVIITSAAVALLPFFINAIEAYASESGIRAGVKAYGNLGTTSSETGLGFGAAGVLAFHNALYIRRRILRFFLLLLTVAFAAATVLSLGRAALLALACVAGLMLLRCMGGRRFLIFMTVAACVSGLLYFLESAFVNALMGRGLSNRQEIWSVLMKGFLEKPLLGVGLTTENLYFIESTGNYRDAHNLYLDTLYRGGIFALLLLSVLVGLCLYLLAGSAATRSYLYLFLYGLIVQAFEGYYLITDPNAFWLYLILPMSMAVSAPDASRRCRDLADFLLPPWQRVCSTYQRDRKS